MWERLGSLESQEKGVPPAFDLCSTSRYIPCAGGAYTFVALRRDGRGDCLGKKYFGVRRSQARAVPFRCAHGAIHKCVHCVAHIRNSALGRVLSLALFSFLGSCLLLLDKQLCHRGLRRCRSPANVTLVGAAEEKNRTKPFAGKTVHGASRSERRRT